MQRETQKAQKRPQNLLLEDRGRLLVSGVTDVDSFDEDTIVAYTDLGEIVIKGKGLHISKLNLETGELSLDGEISGVAYSENQSASTGFFARLFK